MRALLASIGSHPPGGHSIYRIKPLNMSGFHHSHHVNTRNAMHFWSATGTSVRAKAISSMLLEQIKITSAINCCNLRSNLKSEGVDGSTVPQGYYSVAMGILVWSAKVRDLLGKSSFWVTGKG